MVNIKAKATFCRNWSKSHQSVQFCNKNGHILGRAWIVPIILTSTYTRGYKTRFTSFYKPSYPRNHCTVHRLSSVACIYVMRSRGISRKLHMCHVQFSILLKSSLGDLHFAENPSWIGPVVPRLRAFEDSQNNRKQYKCISSSGYISQSILPTSNWSC